jgi:hypothetical protein
MDDCWWGSALKYSIAIAIGVIMGLLGWPLVNDPPVRGVEVVRQVEKDPGKEKALQERLNKVGRVANPTQEAVDKARFTVTKVGEARLLAVFLIRDKETGFEVLVFSTGDSLSSQVVPTLHAQN